MVFGDDDENYKIINGKAFTEDNILVFNLFIYNIPKSLNKDQVFNYFRKFGEVKSVRLLKDQKRKNVPNSPRIGFVNFSDAAAATKVLQNNNHYINKKRIQIRACDSWHQPGAKENSDSTATTSTANNNANSASCSEQEALILQLNDDCLEMILKFLPMVDQINFAQTCCRLKDIFAMHSKSEYKILLLNDLDNLTLWQIRQFLQMAGPHIQTLEGEMIHKHSHRVIESMGLFCTNVEVINIQSSLLKPVMLRKLFKKMKNVKVLTLHDTDLVDSCIPILKNLSNLKELSLDGNCELTGNYLKDLVTVESLSLNSCGRISSRHFTKICKCLTQLRSLEINHCSLLKTAEIKDAFKHLKNLETLKIGIQVHQYPNIAQLPKLKHLSVYSSSESIQADFFAELAKHQSNQLETLSVDNYNCMNLEKATYVSELKKLKKLVCPNNYRFDDECMEKIALLPDLEILCVMNCNGFTSKGLLAVIRSCHKLHTINIGSCKQLNESFAKEVLQLIKSQQIQRQETKVLKISGYRSGIEDFSVKTPEFEAAKDLIEFKLDFDVQTLDDLLYGDMDLIDYDDYYDDDDDDDDYDGLDYLGHDIDNFGDDDYYMYYSDGDDDIDNEFANHLLRHAFLGNFGYGDGDGWGF
ncbi:uncharacterized protein LOC142237460 isoform X2 [Haematobia irritans]|uniref:uncharacterized protein LOC142237460 isoform X2 n=1 Tax=Haematobia irritans TaxID=7368 RepID=UPI003F4F4A48